MSAGTQTTAPNRGVGLEMAFKDAKSDKQYRMYLFGNRVLVEWGRRGAHGQNQVKVFPTVAAAKAWFVEQLASKETKGYSLEVSPRVVEISQDVANLIAAGAAPQDRFHSILRSSTEVL